MPLSIKNAEVERLVAEIVAVTGETKTEAIRSALEARMTALAFRVVGADRSSALQRFLDTEVWPQVPDSERGRRLPKADEEALLGFGPYGVAER